MADSQFPGGMAELEFVEAYARSALRKPQMAAEAALRALVFAESADRAILAGLIGVELAEACRRLTAVHLALGDRRYSIARSLMRPLPGVAEWRLFAHQAGTFTPQQMLWELSLGEDALPQAENLRSQPGLAELEGVIEAATSANPMLLLPGLAVHQVPAESWLAGVSGEGAWLASSFGATEQEAANLADLAAELCSIARGFLMSYLGSRRSAGRRD